MSIMSQLITTLMSLIDSDFLLQLNRYRIEANRCKEPKSDTSLQYKKGSWERYIGVGV